MAEASPPPSGCAGRAVPDLPVARPDPVSWTYRLGHRSGPWQRIGRGWRAGGAWPESMRVTLFGTELLHGAERSGPGGRPPHDLRPAPRRAGAGFFLSVAGNHWKKEGRPLSKPPLASSVPRESGGARTRVQSVRSSGRPIPWPCPWAGRSEVGDQLWNRVVRGAGQRWGAGDGAVHFMQRWMKVGPARQSRRTCSKRPPKKDRGGSFTSIGWFR